MTQWEVAENQIEKIKELAKSLGISPILVRLLWNRGYHDYDSACYFLSSQLKDLRDPFLILGMQKAVDRTLQAIARNEEVFLYGDYDVDGVTSVAIMKRFLNRLGASKVKSFLPDRFDEGYGLTQVGIDRCLTEGKPHLLMVLDCGTNSAAEVDRLQRQGIDVIILDHHEPSIPASPYALVNYKLGTQNLKFGTEFCTAGLVFKFCHALLKRAREDRFEKATEVDLKRYLDLVALATVADIAPLTGENRIFVKYGLRQMERTQFVGLRSLMRVAGIQSEPTVYDCGFRLGPRLNAAGRLESAMASLHLLLSDDEKESESIARQLDATNRERQAEEARVWMEARVDAESQIQNEQTRVLVVARPGWHEGVVGIVASRIMREFHLPTFVVALDGSGMGKGSGRSIEGFNLALAIEATRTFLIRGGGHAMAAGISLDGKQIEPWCNALQAHAHLDQGLDGERLKRRIQVDLEVSLAQLNLDLYNELQRLEPCGMGNPRPVLMARNLNIAGEPKIVGADGKHLKLWFRQGAVSMDAIAFGWGSRAISEGTIRKGGHLDVVFELERNEYRGVTKIQLNVKDCRC